jgi:hypothetical protein
MKFYSNINFFLVWVGNLVFAMRELVQDKYRTRNETANPILFKFEIKTKISKLFDVSMQSSKHCFIS